MRTSRTAIVVASIAIGAAALTAPSASAATPSGITRDMVLTATREVRTAYPPNLPGLKALQAIVNRGCAVNADDGEYTESAYADWVSDGSGGADGLIAFGQISNSLTGSVRTCAVGVVAATAPDRQLAGTMTLTVNAGGVTTFAAPLSGDVSVTPAFSRPGAVDLSNGLRLTAAGSADTTTTTTTSVKVPDRKTASEKKKAKKAYVKRLKAAKKAYAKALDKAGGSKTKRAAAKRTYRAKRSSAKATYRYAIAGYRIVTRSSAVTDARPFSISTPG